MIKKLLILVLLFFFVFLSCSSEKKDWERAESENTIRSYYDFLERHLEGALADKARLKIKELYFEEAESIGTLRAYEDFLKRRCSRWDPIADKARLRIEEIKLFKEVQEVDNIPTYKAFLKDHPQHPRADKVRRRIEELYQDRHPAVKNTETIKITVKQSYSSDFSSSESISLRSFSEMAERVFGGAGLKAVSADVGKADVILKIQAKGRALGAMYKDNIGVSSSYRYTGASLSGTISLKVPGIPVIKKSFKGAIDPPYYFTERQWSDLYSIPAEAPFDDAILRSGSFLTKILEMLEDFYGFAALSRVYERILREDKPDKNRFYLPSHETRYIPRIAEVVALGEIKDKRAIELLIEAMDCSRGTQLKALEKLRSLTGQDLGEEQRIWQNWWKENKHKFLEKK